MGDLEGEAGHEHGLEAQADVDHRGGLLAREHGPLLGRELLQLGEAGQRQQLVGEDLAVAEGAGEVDVGVDHPPQGGGVELLDPAGRRIVEGGGDPGRLRQRRGHVTHGKLPWVTSQWPGA